MISRMLCCRALLSLLVIGLLLAPLSLSSASRANGAATTLPSTQPAVPVGPGDYVRNLVVDGWNRSFLLHVPKTYDPAKPIPLVLAFHGATMNAGEMSRFCRLDEKADVANFAVAYPNGTGFFSLALFFNSFGMANIMGVKAPDDVVFTSRMLDDIETVLNVDRKRVYATGMSNGAMMCQVLGARLANRIAAIAPVSGTIAWPNLLPRQAVPVIEFHGTADAIVPFNGGGRQAPIKLTFLSVDDTIKTWVQADHCSDTPKVTDLPVVVDDGTRVIRKVYSSPQDANVVLYEIEGGGHTWPGEHTAIAHLGKVTSNISANDLIWDFFEKHPMK